MEKLLRILTTFANRHFPEQAYFFAPLLPRLKPTPLQLKALARNGVCKIKLEFRPNVGTVIQRNFWANGRERDTFLSPALRDLAGGVPRDVLLLTKSKGGAFQVRAGDSYRRMTRARFKEILDQLIDFSHQQPRDNGRDSKAAQE